MVARQGNASFEPELMDEVSDADEVRDSIQVCSAICPLGHECATGCQDPKICSKW